MRRLLCSVALGLCLVAPREARASALDFEPYRLGVPDAQGNRRFRTFANQLGTALAGTSMQPPGTLGLSGFSLAVGYAGASVETAAEIWPTPIASPSAVGQPTVLVRKGLPWSFELGGRYAAIEHSRMSLVGLDVKWAPLEGFESLPEASARLHLTRLLGATDFGLLTGGADLAVGKRFSIAGEVLITPYAGWDILLVHATSNVVDFQPTRPLQSALETPTDGTDAFDLVLATENVSHRFYLGLELARSIIGWGLELSWVKPKLLGSTNFAWSTRFALKL